MDTLNKKIISLENRSNIHYSSVSGVAYKVSFNGTTLSIEGDCTFNTNTVIVADNISADNEERLAAVEELCDNVETVLDKKADKEHTHEISDVTGLQDALNNKSDEDHNHDDAYAKIDHTHTLSEITDYSDSGNSSCDFCFLY